MKKYEYYDEADMGPAIICDPPCNYAGKNCPYQNQLIQFDTPEITDEDIRKYQLLLNFLNWIHFEKGVYLARFKRKEGFTFDGMPWTIYLDEHLGLDKHLKNKPRNEQCYISRFLRKKLGCGKKLNGRSKK